MKRNRFKQVLLSLFCLIVLFGLIACGNGNSGGKSQAERSSAGTKIKDQVIIATPLDVTTTDPQGSNTDANMMLYALTHETLVELDPATGNVKPGLAEFQVIDGYTFKFTLPANATFTNGTPCTANDVKFTYERAKVSPKGFTTPKMVLVSSIEVLNDRELILKISQPSQEFLMTLAHRSLSILSEKELAARGDEGSDMGTGMYKLERWIPGDYISVVRYEGYRGGPAKTKRIELRLMKEDSARVIALQTGEIDVCINPPSVELDYIAKDPNLELIQIPNVIMLYLAFNNTKAPLNNPAVRRALAHAVNKQALIIAGYNGLGTPHNNMINIGQFGLDETIKGYDFNLDKAKSLLAEAGYPNGITFELAYDGSAKALMAQVLQSDFAKIGVTLDLQEMENAALKSMLNEKKHTSALYQWTDVDGTDFTVRSMYYTGSGSNRSLIADPALDKMIDEALVQSDVQKRAQMYRDIDRYVTEACPIVPICTSILSIGVRKGLGGVVWMGTAKHDYRGIYAME